MGKQNCNVLIVLAVVVCLTVGVASAYAGASFMGLGDLPGGEYGSNAMAVSGNGEVVVGSSWTATGNEAFRWSASTGMQGLGTLGATDSMHSVAQGVSFDGSVVVGNSTPPGEWGCAFRWTATQGMKPLERLLNASWSSSAAWAVSSDGSVVAGYGTPATGPTQACIWTTAGISALGGPSGGTFENAYAISADGAVVAGYGATANGSGGMRWTAAGGTLSLEGFGGGRGVSGDGSVVVGSGHLGLPGASIWTEAGGTQLLRAEGGGTALAVSANGRVVVGYARDLVDASTFAFVWDQANGMRDLQEVLEHDCNLDLSGWSLNYATGVSADGLVIVGYGQDPLNHTQAWIATLPEPATLSLLALGGLMLLRRRAGVSPAQR